MSKHDLADWYTSMFGKPSYTTSVSTSVSSIAWPAVKGVKLVVFDIPKFIIYDAALCGFAEGLGIREHRELRAPWEDEPGEEVDSGKAVENCGEDLASDRDVGPNGDAGDSGHGVEREFVLEHGGESGRAVKSMERDQEKEGDCVVATKGVSEVSLRFRLD
jgi:hypothetical protein